MSHEIEINYRGYKLYWSDNRDMWCCHEAGDGIESQSLLKLKEKIDVLNRRDRKAAATPCYELNEHSAKIIEAEVIQYLKPRIHRSYYKADEEPEIEHRVAVVARRRGNERASRREMAMKALMPETPEALAAFKLFERCKQIEKAAQEISMIAWKAIPRLQPADIQKLVDLYEAEKEATE